EAFAAAPSISIDHAVMERTSAAAVVPVSMAWTDVGSWSALLDLAPRDEAGNAAIGDVLAEGVRGSYLRSEGPLLAAVGVADLVIVATDDAVLVADRRRDQDVKRIVDRLKAAGRSEATAGRHSRLAW